MAQEGDIEHQQEAHQGRPKEAQDEFGSIPRDLRESYRHQIDGGEADRGNERPPEKANVEIRAADSQIEGPGWISHRILLTMGRMLSAIILRQLSCTVKGRGIEGGAGCGVWPA